MANADSEKQVTSAAIRFIDSPNCSLENCRFEGFEQVASLERSPDFEANNVHAIRSSPASKPPWWRRAGNWLAGHIFKAALGSLGLSGLVAAAIPPVRNWVLSFFA